MKKIRLIKRKLKKMLKHNCNREGRIVGMYYGDLNEDNTTKVTYKCRVCNNVWTIEAEPRF